MKKLLVVTFIITLLVSMVPSLVHATDDSFIPKRVSIYTDEEIAKWDEVIFKGGDLSDFPATRIKGRPLNPSKEPSLNDNPFIDNTRGSRGTAAGYQLFGGPGKPDTCGKVVGETYTLWYLADGFVEYSVLHQWGVAPGEENCLVFFKNGENAVVKVFVSSLGGYINAVNFPITHSLRGYVIAQHSYGSTPYSSVFFLIFDITNGTYWMNTYNLPQQQNIKNVDAALEQDDGWPANSMWTWFANFEAYNKYNAKINLATNYFWFEWPSATMNNEHFESFSGTVGTLYQRKTPK